MKKKIKGFLAIGALFIMIGIKAEMDSNLSFVGTTLDDFLKNFVLEDEQEQFVNFYNKFSEFFGKADKEKQDATYTELFKKAIVFLKNTESDKCDVVVAQIKRLRSCKDKKEIDQEKLQNIKRFLTRCGVYADFIELKKKLAHYKKMETFAGEKFSNFLDKMVEKQDRELFTRYYEKFAGKIAKSDEQKIMAIHNYLFKKALEHISQNHVDWYNVLVPYSLQDNKKGPVITRARLFLRRYGAYQEFLEHKALAGVIEKERSGLFAQIGSFFTNVGKTVVGLFGFGVTPFTTA